MLWEHILEKGKKFGIQPVGLGCRDTLRMEMKYLLYGSDINENITPIEAGLGWITKFDKKDFIGREALISLKNKINRRLVCIQMQEKAIPRNGCKIYSQNKEIGSFTSGTMSPSLGVGIGIGYVAIDYSHIGQNLIINIRGKNKKGIIVKPPFYNRGTLMK